MAPHTACHAAPRGNRRSARRQPPCLRPLRNPPRDFCPSFAVPLPSARLWQTLSLWQALLLPPDFHIPGEVRWHKGARRGRVIVTAAGLTLLRVLCCYGRARTRCSSVRALVSPDSAEVPRAPSPPLATKTTRSLWCVALLPPSFLQLWPALRYPGLLLCWWD